MIAIRVKVDTGPAMRYLADVEKQARFAASRAINATARVMQRELEAEVAKVFDAPVPFTRRAFGVQYSRRDNLTATVFVKDAQAVYLAAQIKGGRRGLKRFEARLKGEVGAGVGYFVPGRGVRLTSAGNLSRQTVVSIANKLRAKGQDVFAGNVRGRFGIWQRTSRGGLKPLLVQIQPPTYRRRLDFFGIGQKVVEREWPRQFERYFADALRTAR